MTTVTEALPRAREWHASREALRATYWLGIREVRNILRQPETWIPSIVMPLFFYFIQKGSLSGIAGGAGLENYEAFVLPVSILFATANEGAGFNMATDIERGFFDKLLLSPAHRLAILIGGMGANLLRVIVQAAIVTAIALALGLNFRTGVAGAAGMVALASMWGLAFGAVGAGVAMKTGNAQATQTAQFILFPLMFLTTAFAPKETMEGWLQTAVSLNPVTYILEGMRGFSHNGDMSDAFIGFVSAAGMSVVTITFALRAMRSRLK